MVDRQKLEDQAVVKLQKDMYEKYESIRDRVRGLQQVIDGLEKQWEGIGRSAFDSKQYEINESLQRIGRILAGVIEAMTKTRDIKDSKEAAVRAAVNKIDVYHGAPTKSPFNSY